MAWEDGFLSSEMQGVISHCQKIYPRHFDLFYKLNRRAVQLQHEITVTKAAQPLTVATLHSRVLAHTQGAVTLASRGMPVQARAVLRAALEALYLLKACQRSKEFTDKYIAADEASRKQFFNKALDLRGAGLFPEAEKHATPERLAEIEAAIEAASAKALKVKEISKAADMYTSYLSVYALFSTAVHTSVRELERHLVLDEERNITGLRNEPDLGETDKLLVTAADFLIVAMSATADQFGVDCAAFLREHRKVLDALAETSKPQARHR